VLDQPTVAQLADDVAALVDEMDTIDQKGPIDRPSLEKACLDEGLLDFVIKFKVSV
jgi:hypothetical protein